MTDKLGSGAGKVISMVGKEGIGGSERTLAIERLSGNGFGRTEDLMSDITAG